MAQFLESITLNPPRELQIALLFYFPVSFLSYVRETERFFVCGNHDSHQSHAVIVDSLSMKTGLFLNENGYQGACYAD